ncbi:hypothetical protein [Streptomyces boncukensis]|uniref:Phage L5-like integrase N-terminal domain-containing protein n=1 Tax=Streptomyces boncukensis TaxID=2711219 RepID=A0A6G4WZM7_9ACTN|nr:hypothetical protein [Streptomyces boncukensis]NGO70749.1 hypothetical protein [Streptomyces boncukensis]
MSRTRRDFGFIRKLPSGRFQASYLAPDGTRRNADRTFRTKTEASAWLADVRARLDKGDWHGPTAGQITPAEWVETYVTTNKRRGADAARRPVM